MEAELSENCLKILALHQPLAGDLRLAVSLSKIAGMLERIGDLAENLARKARSLARKEADDAAGVAEMAGTRRPDAPRQHRQPGRRRTPPRPGGSSPPTTGGHRRSIRKAGEAAIMANPVATPGG